MLKILHVISSPRAEGTVRLTLDWLQHTHGLEQSVFVLSSNPAELTSLLKRHAQTYEEKTALPRGLFKFPWLVWISWRKVCAQRPDVVVCWNTGFSGFVLLGAFLAGTKRLIAHAGNPPTQTNKGRWHGFFTAAVLWIIRARVICCSRYVAVKFEAAHFPKKILDIVWNCAQVDEIQKRAEMARKAGEREGAVVLMVATLESHKDHVTLLKAFAFLRQLRPKSKLWLAGEGRLREALEKLARDLMVSDATLFLGSRSDVPELLGQADLFVFSTTPQEGLGTVLIEALAANLPIVASDVPACRELLEGGRWGTLVPPGDPQLLAFAMDQNLQSTAPQIASERHRFLRNFSVECMQTAYLVSVGCRENGGLKVNRAE